jgi:hypothetical protein
MPFCRFPIDRDFMVAAVICLSSKSISSFFPAQEIILVYEGKRAQNISYAGIPIAPCCLSACCFVTGHDLRFSHPSLCQAPTINILPSFSVNQLDIPPSTLSAEQQLHQVVNDISDEYVRD